MSDVTWNPETTSLKVLHKIATKSETANILISFREMHKEARFGGLLKALKAVGGAAKPVGKYIAAHPSQAFIAASLAAPSAVRAGTKRIVQPVAEGLGDSMAVAVDKPAAAITTNTNKIVGNLGENAQALGNTAKTIITPVKDAIVDSARESGTSFGKALAASALPGMGALAGAGAGGLTGAAIGHQLFSGNKEEARRKRRMLTLLLAGAGGIGGAALTKHYQDKGMIG